MKIEKIEIGNCCKLGGVTAGYLLKQIADLTAKLEDQLE